MSANSALYWALRVAAWLVPFMPTRLAHALATCAGRVAYRLFSAPRENVLNNLSVVLGTRADDLRLGPLAREAFVNDAKNWVDTLRIATTPLEEIERSLDVDHFERIEEALSLRKGLVLVTIHLGNFDLVGQVIAGRGYKLTVPVERMEPARLFDFVVELRTSKGINVVPLDHAPREMIRALKSGEIVGVAGDRTVGGRGGMTVPFFGRETVLPHGPVSLARRTGARLLLGVGIRVEADRFVGHVIGPIPLVHTQDAHADDRQNLMRLAGEMETLIRRYPGQWLNFGRMWPDTERQEGIGTMDQHSGAVV